MKILLMGDSVNAISGFGTALRNLATHLHKVGHDVYTLGWQHFGQNMVASFHKEVLGFTMLPNVAGQKFGEAAIKYWLPRLSPDLLLVLSDFWMIAYIYKTDISTPFCMWYPIDGSPLTDQIKTLLHKVDYRVCMSQYGNDMVRGAGIETHHVPHGVKTSAFKPVGEQSISEMKRKLGIPNNAIVIGRVDRNQTRKKIPRTLKAVKMLQKDFPDVVLLLWMDRRDREGWDLPFVAKRLEFTEGKDLFFPAPDQMANFMYGIPENELATVMNTMYIHSWLTGGEGFGLTGLETMACGVVNVATDYTTPPEIFQFRTKERCGLPVKVQMFECGTAGVDRAFADIGHAYEQMKWLIENPDERKAMSERGIKRAQEVYDWKIVTESFDKYLRDRI